MSSEHGYVCKSCGGPSPVGIGYVDNTEGADERSAGLTRCQCGKSQAALDYVTLTPSLARVARETLADVATPTGSLGVVAKAGKKYVYVDVANVNAEDVGVHRYALADISVHPDTVEYWRRQGYIDAEANEG